MSAWKINTIDLGKIAANCYLIQTCRGSILIDTGRASKLRKLEKEMKNSGCRPEDLSLILLTHGDFDHTGSCAYFQKKYNIKIGMHFDDFGMVERGDMFWNRKAGNVIAKKIVNLLFAIKKFKPDFSVDEGYDLTEYGLDARVIYIPGHSKGSIGILTSEGDLFCGDLFMNNKKPSFCSIIDNKEEFDESIRKIKDLDVKKVYPGHGKPFYMSELACMKNI